MHNEPQYAVSVIMPVYNVEEYLEEAIESVIGQTLGFSDNIQLILVNDGSSDKSGEICKRYCSEYPDNIIYAEKENGGVSSARNTGIEYVSGEYVNFMDSDDIWASDAFSLLYRFLKDNPGIRIASAKLLYTGRSEGKKYSMDYVYNRTCVVDIEQNADLPLFGLPKIFLDADIVKSRRFDTALSISEDQLFLTEILLDVKRFGIVSEAVYYYRKREDNSSAFDGARERKDFYTVTPVRSFLTIIEKSKEKCGCVIPYVQNIMLVNLRLRLKPVADGILTEAELSGYRRVLKTILDVIDDEVILKQKSLMLWQRIYMIRSKCYPGSPDDAIRRKIIQKIKIQADSVRVDDSIKIEGPANEKWLSESDSIYAEDDSGKRFYPEYSEDKDNEKTGIFDEVTLSGYRFRFDLPLKDGAAYGFYEDTGLDNERVSIKAGKNMAAELDGAESPVLKGVTVSLKDNVITVSADGSGQSLSEKMRALKRRFTKGQ